MKCLWNHIVYHVWVLFVWQNYVSYGFNFRVHSKNKMHYCFSESGFIILTTCLVWCILIDPLRSHVWWTLTTRFVWSNPIFMYKVFLLDKLFCTFGLNYFVITECVVVENVVTASAEIVLDMEKTYLSLVQNQRNCTAFFFKAITIPIKKFKKWFKMFVKFVSCAQFY